MRIVLVLNKPNRELEIMKAIKREILSLKPEAHVEIWEMCTPEFNRSVLKFKPDVILTFPFTCTGFATWYYLFKRLFNCKILSLRAEGVVDFKSEYLIQWAVGFDDYGKNLVDYELFWGAKVGEVVGHHLCKQNKLSSLHRVKIVGYPRLESYFSKDHEAPPLPPRIAARIGEFRKQDVLFFVTGFHLANYTRQDLFDARDLDAENKIDELLEAVEISKQYRRAWTESVLKTAEQNPNLLFVVKKHPIEKRENYTVFETVPNILYVYEDVEIQHLLPYAGLFFHYGSTSVVDSYLSGVPSVYVYSKENKSWYSDMNFPVTRKVDVSEVPVLVVEYVRNGISFVMSEGMKGSLKEIFNIEIGKPYEPSKEIAKLILDGKPAQRISFFDPFLWKALVAISYQSLLKTAGILIRKLFRMQPGTPLLKRKKI